MSQEHDSFEDEQLGNEIYNNIAEIVRMETEELKLEIEQLKKQVKRLENHIFGEYKDKREHQEEINPNDDN